MDIEEYNLKNISKINIWDVYDHHRILKQKRKTFLGITFQKEGFNICDEYYKSIDEYCNKSYSIKKEIYFIDYEKMLVCSYPEVVLHFNDDTKKSFSFKTYEECIEFSEKIKKLSEGVYLKL